jgi:hypothetical protein
MKRKQNMPNKKEQARQAKIYAENRKLASEIDQERTRMYTAGFMRAFTRHEIFAAQVLHDKFGFGKKRLQTFMDEMAHLSACVGDDKCDITEKQIAQCLKMETGYDVLWQIDHRNYDEAGRPAN